MMTKSVLPTYNMSDTSVSDSKQRVLTGHRESGRFSHPTVAIMSFVGWCEEPFSADT